jgi:hypothetical protein
VNEVKKYLSNTSVNSPFFLVVGDCNYTEIKNTLSELGLKTVLVSDYCPSPDKPPNLDRLFAAFDFADIDGGSSDKKIVVLGLGEYLAVQGGSVAYTRLNSIKDKKIGNARVVLLLRGVTSIVQRIQNEEAKRSVDRYIYFAGDTASDISVAVVSKEIALPAKNGIKGLLTELENGESIVSVNTNACFDSATIAVSKVKSAFEGIKHLIPSFSLPQKLGTDEQWTELLSALSKTNGDINSLIANYGDNPETNLSHWIGGNSYENWLYFIALKLKQAEINSSYFRFVLDITDAYADLKKNILNSIIGIAHTNSRFALFYNERKDLISRLLNDRKITEADIAAFVSENRRNADDSLYKLTDRTLTERKEFVSLLATRTNDKKKIIDRAALTYGLLTDYLSKYTFTDPKVGEEMNALLTEYFEKYKTQKIENKMAFDFLEQIERLAQGRKYNALRTREEVLTSIADKDSAFLYWVDALGVEFLGFVQRLCERKGLSLRIHIAQAILPTITSINKGFYDEWDSSRKQKEERLDELKHKESGGYNYENEQLPVHLSEELDVIETVIEKAATMLALHQFNKILIVSDHGASRLAVINGQEEKYETDTKGKHGGRCCIRPDDYSPTVYDLPFATESPDGKYLVLANYGRFKGSRKANVEVHGGATLEEVVIPIIELTLANPQTSIEVLNVDKVFASFRKPLEFVLFSKTELQSVRVIFKDKTSPYIATKTDKTHYRVATDIKRPGKYEIDIFDGDSLIGKLTLDVQSETQKQSGLDDFDNLFN